MTSSKHDYDYATKADDKAAVKPAKPAKTLPKRPSGGDMVGAGAGYSVISAMHDDAGNLVFLPGLPVIAWQVGADGVTWPVTAAPIDAKAHDAAVLQVDGSAVTLDGMRYAGAAEWQTAIRLEDDAAKAAATEAEAAKEAKTKAA